jgi:hypothetical protein
MQSHHHARDRQHGIRARADHLPRDFLRTSQRVRAFAIGGLLR